MSIINRRNAVVGWLALSVGKRALKKKARDAAPVSIRRRSGRTRRCRACAGRFRRRLHLLAQAVVGLGDADSFDA